PVAKDALCSGHGGYIPQQEFSQFTEQFCMARLKKADPLQLKEGMLQELSEIPLGHLIDFQRVDFLVNLAQSEQPIFGVVSVQQLRNVFSSHCLLEQDAVVFIDAERRGHSEG